MGKTQIALQHAHDPQERFQVRLVAALRGAPTLLEDYISIARDLHLPGLNLRDTDQTVKTVKLWLEVGMQLSLAAGIRQCPKAGGTGRYIPVAGSGQVIITSRQSVWDGIAETLKVGIFQRDKMQGESIDFLLKRTENDDRKGAADLAQELGDLPLALEQAGAYIKDSGISFSDYEARLKKLKGKDRKDLLSKGKPRDIS